MLELCRERGLSRDRGVPAPRGLVARKIDRRSRRDEVFRGGVVAYDDLVKQRELDVPGRCCDSTARSPPKSPPRWRRVRERLGADVAVAVTSVAGQGGGTAEKPVGLVFLHVAGPDGARDVRFELPGERDWIRSRSAVAALPPTPALDTEPARSEVSSGATVTGDERLRLFLALRLRDVVRDRLAAGLRTLLVGPAAWCPARICTSRLLSSARVPPARLGAIVAALHETKLAPVRSSWRRQAGLRPGGVGMVKLDDAGGAAGRLAWSLHQRLEGLGVYRREARPWLARHRRAVPRTSPAQAAAARARSHRPTPLLTYRHPSGARYEVLASTLLGGRG